MTPRLLNERDVAAYLTMSVAAVRRTVSAGRLVLDGHLRWDRLVLDEWLDGLGRRGAQSAANQNPSGPDAALSQWLSDTKNAARRS